MNHAQPSPHSPDLTGPTQHTVIAWAAWTSALLLVTLCLALTRLNNLTTPRYIEEYILAMVLGTLAFATVGALITAQRPDNPIGWLLSACGLALGALGAIQQFTRYSLVTQAGALSGGDLLGWINIWAWIPSITLFVFYLPLLFPTGKLPSPRWRSVVWLMITGTFSMTLVAMISPGPADASLLEVSNPYTPPWASLVLPWLTPLGLLLMLISMGFAAAAPVIRMRRAEGVERQQIKWFAFGSAIMLLCFLIPILIYFPNFTTSTWLSGLLLCIGIPALPAAVGIAVLRHRLYEIDFLIRRTLLYTTLTILLAVVYFGSVLILQQALYVSTGRAGPLAVVVSTLLIAGLFGPLRARLQRFIDRLFYRQKYDAGRVLASFSTVATSEVDLERLSGLLLESVDHSLQPESLSIWLVRDPPARNH